MTAVQMVAAFSAVANGGRLMQPQIIRAVLDAQGREVRSFEPIAVRQVISPDTARTLTEMMVNVVRNGTGHNAAIPGYDVAGKTGTAQKMDPATRRYSRAPGVLSFVGFVPADDPRLAMIVLLDEPKNEKWGSEAAAPIFSAIGREALRYLNVAPRDSSPVPIVRGEMPSAAPEKRARDGAPAEGPALDASRDARRGAARAASASTSRPLSRRGGDAAARPASRCARRWRRLAPHGVRLEISRPRRGDEPAPAARRAAAAGNGLPAAPGAHGRAADRRPRGELPAVMP